MISQNYFLIHFATIKKQHEHIFHFVLPIRTYGAPTANPKPNLSMIRNPPTVEHVFIHGPVWVAKVCREGLAVVLKNQIATNNLHARPSILATKQPFQATGHRIAYTTCPRASIVQQPSRIYPKPEVPSLP